MVPLENYLVLSAIIFSLGVYGVLARRSAVLILMSVELMLNAVSLNFVAFAAYLDPASLRDQIGFASAKGIRYAIIAGGTEFQSDTVMVKDLDLRTQVTVAKGELVAYIKAGLSQN